MTGARVHVIGGGLAGLSAAVALVEAGRPVTLYEAGPALGGRCRSYEDRALGCRIDNGNHLLLSGNRAVFDHLDRFGMRGSLRGPGRAMFPFADLRTPARWTLDLGRGRIPFWVLDPRRRVPGMRLRELAAIRRLMTAGPHATVAECLLPGALADRLLAPLAVSALNTPIASGSAALLGAVMRESLALGGAACVPSYPAEGLSESFIDPAAAWLRRQGAEIRTGWRVAEIAQRDGRVVGFSGPDGPVDCAADEAVVLAVPAPVATALLAGKLPGFTAPDAFEAILNLHFRHDDALTAPLARAAGEAGASGFLGVVGGMTEWVFLKPGILSVTISAANRYLDIPNDLLAGRIWAEIRAALPPEAAALLPEAPPPVRVVREKRATFAATAAQEALRPGCNTSWDNIVLAGDWTATRLPATIEGAMRSGLAAARALDIGRGRTGTARPKG